MVLAPVNVIATRISFSIKSSKLLTPEPPAAPSAYTNARPSMQISAPIANIRTTSRPLRIPESAKILMSPLTALAIEGSARAEDKTPSS